MEILAYTFMQRALVASVMIGTVCAIIGTYVVLRGLSFIGAGIAHASFGGVALGFLLGVNPFVSAILFCLFTAWGIGWTSERGKIREDTAIGIFFASTMALGVFFVGMMKVYNLDLFGYLFGNVLAVTKSDLVLSVSLGALVLLMVFLFFKELLFVTFDQEMAQVTGVPARSVYYLLLGLIAVTIVISIKVVGIILVSALLVIPPASAYQLTEDFGKMMLLSVIIGVASSVAGLFFSYWLDVASGATIVLTATTIFFVASILSPRRRYLRRRQRDLLREVVGSESEVSK